MRKLISVALVGALCSAAPVLAQSGAPRSGTNSPTASHDNPSSCLGAERATRNSNGGDRAQGVFGQDQSAYVADLNASGDSYGQWLQTWKEACENAPGDHNDDG